ncbi:hypothetical protein DFQ05_1255 [Winogradskyella wandonensis]|uniref:Uncharacterized protein n=1 Tax=Winogradskyella wandonensis TaxID=1442586 RepID=A0A4R1KTB0_9FLAO|nr:hypothetical protein [Winogradskyella wandonensis]TCK67479.1 hypothetical protein DFQ05_1255 [Winogradskyella wandonensis]
MKRIFYIILCLCSFSFSQENIELKLEATAELKAYKIFGVDTFGTLYYSDKNHSFYKKSTDTIISYANFQLGEISSANTFNPLKINLFYQDFNTMVVLDNRLAEITKVDFNTLSDYKNVTLISTGYDNFIWLFNQDLQQLELFDYLSKKTRIKTVPVQSQALSLKSDYNYCYLLTENYLYVYSYFGSLIHKIENNNFTDMAFSKGQLILKSGNNLFLLAKNSKELKTINTEDLLINQFLVTDETLYIYNDEKLRRYQLKSQ